jgi:hypothetical protein
MSFSDDKFLGEFFHNSRLHHISTMGASFKSYVSQLRLQNAAKKFPARQKLRQMAAGQRQVLPFEPLKVGRATFRKK